MAKLAKGFIPPTKPPKVVFPVVFIIKLRAVALLLFRVLEKVIFPALVEVRTVLVPKNTTFPYD